MAARTKALGISILAGDQVAGAFGRKREFIAIALECSPATTVVRIGVLPSRMREILATVEAATETSSLRHAALARGVGAVYVALLPESRDEDSRQRVSRVVAEIESACQRAGGQAVVPWCPTEWKSLLKIWGTDRADLAQMRKLKSVFDPQGILSPGRFVAGL